MQKFRLTDHIHYDRNDPGQPQSVYFDIDPVFHARLNKVLAEVEASLNRDKIDDILIALTRTSQAIEQRFGDLSLGELLYVAHSVSSMLAANTADHFGYIRGYNAAIAQMKPTTVSVHDINRLFGKKGGIA